MRKCISTVIILSFAIVLQAQVRPIGEWASHFSYQNINRITVGQNRIFCSSENGLFSLNGNETNILFKNDGLSDVAATYIYYDDIEDILLIGYKSGLIDQVSPDHVTTIRTLQSADIISDRAINHIVKNENDYYLATDLGLAFLDSDLRDIRDVYRDIGPDGQSIIAHRVLIERGFIYLWANVGILRAEITSNLFDFNNWDLIVNTDTLSISNMEAHSENVLFSAGNDLFEIQNISIRKIKSYSTTVVSLYHSGDQSFIMVRDSIYEYTGDTMVPVLTGNFASINDFLVDENIFWLASRGQGLIKLTENSQENIIPNGPTSDAIKNLRSTGSTIALLYSSLPENVFSGNFDQYKQNRWVTSLFDHTVFDLADYGNTTYLATSNGLYNLTEERFTEELINDTVTAVAAKNSWLWATAYGSNTLNLFDGESWFGYPPSISGTTRPVDLTISEFDVAWITKGNEENGGIAVYEPLEDQFRLITSSDGLPSNNVKNISVANNDEVWVTTTGGLVSFFDASFIFNDQEEAGELFFQGGPLLEGQVINATAFDGGNRKWVGTNNGLWLFDRSLSEQLAYYTEQNSPLPSNRILDLAYQPISGQMFILTDKGLVSLQTDSSEPLAQLTEVLIYPNPARLSDNQPVGIKGVAGNAIIKITSPEGILIEEISANGSTFSWDLRDYRGNKVSAGVYLFFSSDRDGEEAFIGKIAVIP